MPFNKVHYEISNNHTPANCPGANILFREQQQQQDAASSSSSLMNDTTATTTTEMSEGRSEASSPSFPYPGRRRSDGWLGVKWDARRSKWRAVGRVRGKETALVSE
jgi:hypothetical protein